jgi:hypothetical protein
MSLWYLSSFFSSDPWVVKGLTRSISLYWGNVCHPEVKVF